MNSRELVLKALNHEETSKIPIDFGATPITGISASVVSKLKDYYGLSNNDLVKIIEPYQMLGEITDGLKEKLGVDCVGLSCKNNIFGFENNNWKSWELFDGTKVLVPGKFNTRIEDDGSVLQYPQGDNTVVASARMPKDGYYFDSIIRQKDLSKGALKFEGNLEEFVIIDDDELKYLEKESYYLYENTDFAIIGNFGGLSFGDIALVPGPSLKDPKGIRDIEEWYISLATRKNFVYELFSRQCEIALKNLERIYQAVSDRINVIVISTTDFGTQRGPFISIEVYRELFKPLHIKLNSWIHGNTKWKTFMHSCGSINTLMDDFIKAGFDIINPVQLSAEGMGAVKMKEKYGSKVVFWGGGIDTQKTLPFGTVEEIVDEVSERIKIFSKDGGFIFSAIHNIQAKTPIENITKMIEIVKNYK